MWIFKLFKKVTFDFYLCSLSSCLLKESPRETPDYKALHDGNSSITVSTPSKPSTAESFMRTPPPKCPDVDSGDAKSVSENKTARLKKLQRLGEVKYNDLNLSIAFRHSKCKHDTFSV